jgi:hypothetical protein
MRPPLLQEHFDPLAGGGGGLRETIQNEHREIFLTNYGAVAM